MFIKIIYIRLIEHPGITIVSIIFYTMNHNNFFFLFTSVYGYKTELERESLQFFSNTVKEKVG